MRLKVLYILFILFILPVVFGNVLEDAEVGVPATNWTQQGTNPAISFVTDTAFNGSKSIKIDRISGSSAHHINVTNWPQNKSINISIWINHTRVAMTATFRIVMVFNETVATDNIRIQLVIDPDVNTFTWRLRDLDNSGSTSATVSSPVPTDFNDSWVPYRFIIDTLTNTTSIYVNDTLIVKDFARQIDITHFSIEPSGSLSRFAYVDFLEQTIIDRPAIQSAVFVINNTVNFTSDGGEICGFNGARYTVCGNTSDTTPTFRFNVLDIATCKLWNDSKNFTILEETAVINCTSEVFTQTCTFPVALPDGNHELFISCKAGDFEMNSFIHANALNITIGPSRFLTSTLHPNISEVIYTPNWSLSNVVINFTSPEGMAGNFTANHTEFNITPKNFTVWVYNVSAPLNESVRVFIHQNQTKPWYHVFIRSIFGLFNITNVSQNVMNITAGQSEFFNITLDLFNASQEYINWTLVGGTNRSNWDFNITINSTRWI